MNNTRLLCLILGWQGGTVHQVAEETGLTVRQIIDSSRDERDYRSNESPSPFVRGWFAVRTCDLEYNRKKIFPKHKGDLAFWMGACAGKSLFLADVLVDEVNNQKA